MLKPGYTRLLFLFILWFTVNQGLGQIQPINFRHYSLEDGLSSYKVAKVLQDRFGFIWVATQDGLNRFDGKDIVIYNKTALEKIRLAGNDITDILEDTSRNMLWVISSYGGLNGIDLRTGNVKVTVRTDEAVGNFSHGWLKCLKLHKGELWIGSFDGISIYNPDNGRLMKSITIPFQKPKKDFYYFDINQFYSDEFGRVWAFIANYGLVIYSGTDHSVLSFHDLESLHLPRAYIYKRFHDCQSLGKGKLLVATNDGIKRITYDQTGLINFVDERVPGIAHTEISSMELDKDGSLWFASNAGLSRFNLGDAFVTQVKDVNTRDQKKWLSSIYSFFFDKQDHLWLGTLQGFATAPTTNAPFLNYFQSPDLKVKINRAYYVFPYNDSVQFVCADDGFYRVDNATDNITTVKTGLAYAFMFRHRDGNLIVSGENRLSVYQPGGSFVNIEKVYPELSVIADQTINNAAHWKDSLVFLGSEAGKGVFVWNYVKHTLEKINTESALLLKSDIVNSVYRDKLDRIWILSDNCFALYDPATRKLTNHELKNPENGQPLTFFFDICEAGSSYWMASYGSGIIKLNKDLKVQRIISTEQGMPNAGVYKLFPAHDSLLYATTNNGLCRINTNHISVSNYFANDGLHSNAFEENCGVAKDGIIYAGGPDGFSIIKTKYITTNPHSPALFINKVVIETPGALRDTTNLFMQSVKLPDNTLQATIHFSGQNYLSPERMIFAYRIKERHTEWINIGNQNYLPVNGFPPGSYTFQLKGANEDGVWSEPVELNLIFLPKWYQTLWFQLLLLLLVAALLYLLYLYRITQLKKFMAVRTHISQDLHDEIGSTLSGIGLMSEMAKRQLDTEKIMDARTSLEKISFNAGEVLAMMSDIVWAINPKNDSFEKMINRLRAYAANTTNSNGIKLHFESEQEDLQRFNLSMQRRKNIYLICKEAINNAARYSGCRNLYFSLGRENGQISIGIRDDGKGFNAEQHYDGNGLNNMRARAKEIKVALQIKSGENAGTSIQLFIKLT